MLPVIAIVGAVNVGKSSVFNALLRERLAIVDALPGTTRDRNYSVLQTPDQSCCLIDTGGLVLDKPHDPMTKQMYSALEEAQLVLWVVDGRSGCTPLEHAILQLLRRFGKTIFLVVNHTERLDDLQICSEFSSLGLEIWAVVAKQAIGIAALRRRCLEYLASNQVELPEEADYQLKLAIIGRPNAGKSTLINTFVASDRVITSEIPGTTTDALFIPARYRSYELMLMDTAGVRRNKQAYTSLEKQSVEQAMKALRFADVVVLLIGGDVGLCEQDIKLVDKILQSYKPFIIAVNKIDCLNQGALKQLKQQLMGRLPFFPDPYMLYISATKRRGISKVIETAMHMMKAIHKSPGTSQLNQILQHAIAEHPPAMTQGKRAKLRYIHLGDHQPFTLVIHGTGLDGISAAYQKYLANYFRQKLKFQGIPIRLKWLEAHRLPKGAAYARRS